MMSKPKQATDQANISDTPEKNSGGKNLIQLEGADASAALPNELNRKIGEIDADLDDLRSELSETNKGVKSRLSHLSEKESDLTTKVSETYQQLGELDNAYKSLASKSAQISQEIKSVSKQLVQVTDKTDSEMGALNSGIQTLIERTDELAKKSKRTTQTLNKSIKDNAKMLSELESQLLTEINTLAANSQQRDDTLDNKTDEISRDLVKAEEEIKSSQARLLKLQAVDQALENRVAIIESTASELTKKSRELSRSTTQLNKRSSELSSAIEELKTQTEEHSGLIADLQDRAEQTARALVSLIMLEKKHFRMLGGAIALLVVAMLGFLLYDNANWSAEQQQNIQLQSDINTNKQQLFTTQKQLAELGGQTTETNSTIQQELSNVNQKLTVIGDQVDSLDGRVTNMRPHRSFGNNNVIHSGQWLTQQPANHYTIHLATVTEKQQLYKLAERYHSQLQDELAYLPVTVNQTQKYALLYGNYPSRHEADTTLNRLPRMIERRRPTVHSMQQVQAFLPN